MSVNAIFSNIVLTFRQKGEAAMREFIESRVNVGDLKQLQGIADFEEMPEIAYALWEVRTA